MQREGLLFIVSSPSGAGKSTLSRMLMAWDPSIQFSISATTRKPRPGEVDGLHYYYKSREEFDEMVKSGKLLEYAEVFGNLYGSPIEPTLTALKEGRDTLFDIDWQGGQLIRNSPLGIYAVSVFILPPSIAELDARLHARATDSAEVIAGRMARSQSEISHWPEYDYVLINYEVEKCFSDLQAILRAERLRRTRQPHLSEFVRTLNREFEDR